MKNEIHKSIASQEQTDAPQFSSLKLRLMAPTAARPPGFTKPTLSKVPPLGTVAQPSPLPGRIRAVDSAPL